MINNIEYQANLKDVLSAVFKHKLLIFACTFIVVTSVIIITSEKKRLFQAETSLLIKMGRENIFSHTSPIGTQTMVNTANKAIMKSELAILGARDLAEATLMDIGLKNIYPDFANSKTNNSTGINYGVETAIRLFQASISKRNIENTNLLNITFIHTDPFIAATSLNKFVDNYLIQHLKIYQEPGQFIFIKKQVETYKKKLKNSEEELYNYKKYHDILEIGEQKASLLNEISRFKTKVADNIITKSEIEDRLKRLNEQELSGESTEANIDSITNIRGRVNSLKLDEQNLLSKYTSNNIIIVNIRNEIKAAETLIKEEELAYFIKEKKNISEDLKTIKSELKAQDEYLNKYINEIEILKKAELRLNELVRKVSLDKSNYQLYAAQLEESRISNEMDKQKLANIRVIEKASAPLRSIKTNRRLSVLLSVLIGLLLGVLIAIMIEFFNHHFNNIDDINRYLQLKSLASIPKI